MSFRLRLPQLFGDYDHRIDTYPDVNGKGINERYQEEIGGSIDDELIPLVKNLLPLTIEAQSLLSHLLPHAEHMLGFDRKNNTLRLGDTEAWTRRILAHMVRYYHIKGTVRCYHILFEILGLEATITEYWPNGTFDDPALTLDDPTRPLLDLGHCTPCSGYDIDLVDPTGTLDIAAMEPFIESIIRFNEPINARRGRQTWNTVPFTPGNPPTVVCDTLNIAMTAVVDPDDATMFFARIIVPGFQAVGMTVGQVQVRVDHGPWMPVTGLTINGPAVFAGPFPSGSVVDLRAFQSAHPQCVRYIYGVTWTMACPAITGVNLTQIENTAFISVEWENFSTEGSDYVVETILVSHNGAPFTEHTWGPSTTLVVGPFFGGGTINIRIPHATREECIYTASLELVPVSFDLFQSVTNSIALCGEDLIHAYVTIIPEPPITIGFDPGILEWRPVSSPDWIYHGPVTWGDVALVGPIASGTPIIMRVSNLTDPSQPYVSEEYAPTCPVCPVNDHIINIQQMTGVGNEPAIVEISLDEDDAGEYDFSVLRYRWGGGAWTEVPWDGSAPLHIGPYHFGSTIEVEIRHATFHWCWAPVGSLELTPAPLKVITSHVISDMNCGAGTMQVVLNIAAPVTPPVVFQPDVMYYRVGFTGSWVLVNVLAWGDVLWVTGVPTGVPIYFRTFNALTDAGPPYVDYGPVQYDCPACPIMNTEEDAFEMYPDWGINQAFVWIMHWMQSVEWTGVTHVQWRVNGGPWTTEAWPGHDAFEPLIVGPILSGGLIEARMVNPDQTWCYSPIATLDLPPTTAIPGIASALVTASDCSVGSGTYEITVQVASEPYEPLNWTPGTLYMRNLAGGSWAPVQTVTWGEVVVIPTLVGGTAYEFMVSNANPDGPAGAIYGPVTFACPCPIPTSVTTDAVSVPNSILITTNAAQYPVSQVTATILSGPTVYPPLVTAWPDNSLPLGLGLLAPGYAGPGVVRLTLQHGTRPECTAVIDVSMTFMQTPLASYEVQPDCDNSRFYVDVQIVPSDPPGSLYPLTPTGLYYRTAPLPASQHTSEVWSGWSYLSVASFGQAFLGVGPFSSETRVQFKLAGNTPYGTMEWVSEVLTHACPYDSLIVPDILLGGGVGVNTTPRNNLRGSFTGSDPNTVLAAGDVEFPGIDRPTVFSSVTGDAWQWHAAGNTWLLLKDSMVAHGDNANFNLRRLGPQVIQYRNFATSMAWTPAAVNLNVANIPNVAPSFVAKLVIATSGLTGGDHRTQSQLTTNNVGNSYGYTWVNGEASGWKIETGFHTATEAFVLMYPNIEGSGPWPTNTTITITFDIQHMP